jgi:hypothetical protein
MASFESLSQSEDYYEESVLRIIRINQLHQENFLHFFVCGQPMAGFTPGAMIPIRTGPIIGKPVLEPRVP